MTPSQADHVALLGRVWGFLKYHHPAVASGEHHWDFELFRVLPLVLAAADVATCRQALVDWIDSVGLPTPCQICPEHPAEYQLHAPVAWLEDEDLLGPDLAARLQAVYKSRAPGFPQFYVTQSVSVGNPEFQHELDYAWASLPDAGYRILAVVRYWNMIEYWFPYRNLVEQPWPAVLRDVLPRVVAAQDPDAYRLALLAFIARVRDTHANLWSAVDVRPPRGGRRLAGRLPHDRGSTHRGGVQRPGSGPVVWLRAGRCRACRGRHPVWRAGGGLGTLLLRVEPFDQAQWHGPVPAPRSGRPGRRHRRPCRECRRPHR